MDLDFTHLLGFGDHRQDAHRGTTVAADQGVGKALAAGEIPDRQEQERVKYLLGGWFKGTIGYFSKVKSEEAWLNEQAKEQTKRARKKDASLVKYKPKSLFEDS